VKRRTRSSGLPPKHSDIGQLPKTPQAEAKLHKKGPDNLNKQLAKTPKAKVKFHKNGLVDLTETPPRLFEKYSCLRCSGFIR
jgi:hypothetical protein